MEPSTGMLRSVGVSRGTDFHGKSRATATPKRGDTHTVPAGISCEARHGTIYAQRNHSILQSRPAGMAQWVASCHVTSIRVRLATLRRKRAAATRRHWHRVPEGAPKEVMRGRPDMRCLGAVSARACPAAAARHERLAPVHIYHQRPTSHAGKPQADGRSKLESVLG